MGSLRGTPYPNYFIAVPIAHPQILSNVVQLQKSLTSQNLFPPWNGLTDTSVFMDAMVPPTRLHFTLMVMHLKGEHDIENAQAILAEVCSQIHKEFVDNPLELTIEGLGNFGRSGPSIVYARLKDTDEALERLGMVRDLFRTRFNEEFGTPIDPRPFTPHLTIGKSRASRKLRELGIHTFPEEVLSSFEDTNFGSQLFTGVQLLQMGGSSVDRNEPYLCHGEYTFFELLPTDLGNNVVGNLENK